MNWAVDGGWWNDDKKADLSVILVKKGVSCCSRVAKKKQLFLYPNAQKAP